MLHFTYSLNALLMMGLPVALGFFLARKLGVRWRLFGIGAATFLASQVVHIPLVLGLTALFAKGLLPSPPKAWQLLFNATVLGVLAGLCEETARYFAYRTVKSMRTWRQALMFGAGHGGIEAIILGVLAASALVNMATLRSYDVNSLPVGPEQRASTAAAIAAYWSAPWHATLLGAVERVFALCMHLSLAVMVLQVFLRKSLLWLAAAVLWHASANAVAVLVLGNWGAYWAEAAVGGFALMSLGIVFALKPSREEAESITILPGTSPEPVAPPNPEDELRRQIDDSKFQ